jgi:hypothetical protein
MRAFQCWLLTSVCFLAFCLGSEWFARAVLKDPAVTGLGHAERTLVRMFVLGLAFALAVDVIKPWLLRTVRKVHGAVRGGRGAFAGVLVALLLMAAVFAGYYFTYP